MIACGLVLIGVLTTVPHLVKSRAIAEDAAALLAPKAVPAEAEAAARPTEAAPSFDAASWYAARGEAPESHGVLVETFGGEQVLASLNADATFNPASLLKLSTSLVALKKLGAGYRFRTSIFVDDDTGRTVTLRVENDTGRSVTVRACEDPSCDTSFSHRELAPGDVALAKVDADRLVQVFRLDRDGTDACLPLRVHDAVQLGGGDTYASKLSKATPCPGTTVLPLPADSGQSPL